MDQRFWRVVILSVIILIGGSIINSYIFPPPPRPQAAKQPAAADAAKPGEEAKKPGEDVKQPEPPKPEDKKPDEKRPEDGRPEDGRPEPAVIQAEDDAAQPPEQLLTLGSLNADAPYRMLVTLSNRGAALSQIELNSPRFRGDVDRSGYLGYVADTASRGEGCRLRLVGPGTPAEAAGLRGERWIKQGDQWKHEPGDLITAVGGEPVVSTESLERILSTTRYGDAVELTVKRDRQELQIPVVLGRAPLQIVSTEKNDPLSMLVTFQQLDEKVLKLDKEDTVALGRELAGVGLWTSRWEIIESDQEHAVFRRAVPGADIEVRKTFRLATVPAEGHDDPLFRAYHLQVQIELRNTGAQPREVAYQFDGPNGLPIIGAWYASKVSRVSGEAGMRDVLISMDGAPQEIHTTKIAKNDVPAPFQDAVVNYAGVDTQFFAALLIPKTTTPGENWIARAQAIRIGAPDAADPRFTNVSCRLVSKPRTLEPGESLSHSYTLFAGPKRPELLAQYGLDDVIYYGWPIFAVVAVPLVKILHALYWLVPNYGIAIILLTVLVRGCMFPLSRKQALNAQKMQELQPEIRKIQEKYKKDMEGRTKAQQELFRKHNYNPLGGCLLLFIQLPIFIGLYRALMIDVDLWQAALFGEQIRWCSNLAAPDMFYNWSRFMPEWVNTGRGIFALGPYLNVLPILTVLIFNWQQKLMMPPPADEQQAMQQKIMKYMMLFMGVLFFKVASGLCIYFIASSLWGLAERKFLPKRTLATPAEPQTRADAKAEARAAAEREAKARKKSGERR